MKVQKKILDHLDETVFPLYRMQISFKIYTNIHCSLQLTQLGHLDGTFAKEGKEFHTQDLHMHTHTCTHLYPRMHHLDTFGNPLSPLCLRGHL